MTLEEELKKLSSELADLRVEGVDTTTAQEKRIKVIMERIEILESEKSARNQLP